MPKLEDYGALGIALQQFVQYLPIQGLGFRVYSLESGLAAHYDCTMILGVCFNVEETFVGER